MAVVLALVSALAYGISDFLGGIFTKRAAGRQVAVVGQLSAATCSGVAVLAVGGDPTRTHLLLGAGAGVCTGFGVAFLYRGLARGRMGVVAPVSAIGSAVVPLAVGVVQGDRPSSLAVVGLVCAFPAIWLISRDPGESDSGPSGLGDGVLAGIGFGGLFALIGQVPDTAGFGPLAVAHLAGVVGVVGVAVTLRQRWVPRQRTAWWGLLLGPLGFTASGAFLLATHQGLLSVVSVISALYPAATVVLAWLVLSERIGRGQGVGLVTAAAAVTLVALG